MGLAVRLGNRSMVGKLCSCSLACANGFCSPSARNVFSNDRSFTTATAAISLLRCFLPRSPYRDRSLDDGELVAAAAPFFGAGATLDAVEFSDCARELAPRSAGERWQAGYARANIRVRLRRIASGTRWQASLVNCWRTFFTCFAKF